MGMQGAGVSRQLTEVRMFLSANSANELVRKQLLNNVKFGMSFSYTDFTQSPIDKLWYCWFLIDLELIEEKKNTKPLLAGDSVNGDTE